MIRSVLHATCFWAAAATFAQSGVTVPPAEHPADLGVIQLVTPEPESKRLLTYADKLEHEGQQAAAGQARQNGEPEDARMQPSASRGRQRSPQTHGIYVDDPKVYDDSLLQQMLNSAQSRLGSIEALESSGVTKAVGNISGGRQQIVSAGVNAGEQFPQPNAATTISPTTAPGATTALPASASGSASDVLNEQVQLTYEVANLRLLLEGALSDQIMTLPHETFTKPRVTLGFPVAISPEKRFKDAVAIVEVLVETDPNNDATNPTGEPPSITALLPREKTYNVASITDRSASLGGGYAAGIAGVGGSFLWGKKTYFIVKDQDTLALQFYPAASDLTTEDGKQLEMNRTRAFAWQFRPVLGQRFVQAGTRQVFVQLSFPGRAERRVDPNNDIKIENFGYVYVRTYWRNIDTKTGVLKDIVPASSSVDGPVPIPIYDMHQRYGAVAAFNQKQMEDLGTGQMLVRLEGKLLPGSYLRMGPNIIRPETGSLPSDQKTTRFVANIADLATLKTYVVSRDGTEFPLTIKSKKGGNAFVVDSEHVRMSALDDSTSVLQVPISGYNQDIDIPPSLLIGGKVYGYADAPIDRDCRLGNRCVLSVALPTAQISATPQVKVLALMANESPQQVLNRTFSVFSQSSVPERLVYAAKESDGFVYLLYGSNLNELNVIWPAENIELKKVAGSADDNTLRLVKLPAKVVTDSGQILLQRTVNGSKPYSLPIPAPPSGEAPAAAKKDVAFAERIVVGADQATLTGDHLDTISAVKFKDQPLTIGKRTANLIKLSGLKTSGASATAGSVDIAVIGPAGPRKAKLEVVSTKVEVVQK